MAYFYRRLTLLLLSVVTLSQTALAQSSTASPVAVFALLPQCAVNCILLSASQHGCLANNLTCLCATPGLEEEATWCIRDNCTALETLYAKNTTSIACEVPIRDKRSAYATTSITLGVITGALVLLRCAHRLFIARTSFAPDDWMCLVTTLFGVPSTVLNVHGLAASGLGRDVWTLPYSKVYRFLQFLYVMQIQYYLDVSLLKITLLLFYLRIFPFQSVRRVLWVTAAFVVVFGVLFVGLAIFQCTPVSYYWTRWDGLHHGRCLNINAIAWANAATSIAVDIWMLAIPLWQLRSLRLHWKKKIGVALMFCVGTFALRLQSLLNFANSINPTWEDYAISNWSTIEINVGIMCACMPSLRLLLVYFFPKIVGSTDNQPYNNHRGYYMSNMQKYKNNNSMNATKNNLESTIQNQRPTGAETRFVSNMVATPVNLPSADASLSDIPSTSGTINFNSDDGPRQHIRQQSIFSANSLAKSAFPSVSSVRILAAKVSAPEPTIPANNSIMYTASYTIEHATSDFHDQARLVYSPPSLAPSPSTRQSNTGRHNVSGGTSNKVAHLWSNGSDRKGKSSCNDNVFRSQEDSDGSV